MNRQQPPNARPLGTPLTEGQVVKAMVDAGFSLDQIYEFLRRKPL